MIDIAADAERSLSGAIEMPFGIIGDEFVYISRRNLCDECTLKSGCISPSGYRFECAEFQPQRFVFNRCIACGKSYEIHTAWKNDFLDECPECNEKRKERRLRD